MMVMPAPAHPEDNRPNPHYLDPLLRPGSIAVVGASERAGSVGHETIKNLLLGNYSGTLYPVNPGREKVFDMACYPDLISLPQRVEHVIFAIADRHIESALASTIEHGAHAATIMSSLVLEDDEDPPLRQRIQAMVDASSLLLCGANGMGFYNFADGVWACGFDTRPNHRRGGNVTLISHSGSGMCGIVDCEERIDFNLAVSTGQELSVAMHDYMDFALERKETRVIGLFIEAARNPEALMAALHKANRRGVPVVAIKVGRTELSARLAVSHSGAIAGQDRAYDALFDRYGVQRVYDMDEFAHALMMFAQPHEMQAGGLVSLHDSGGERQLMIDLADQMDVPLATLGADTVTRLEELLDPGLPAVNPLDAWSAGGPDADTIMEESLATMLRDDEAAAGAEVHDREPLSALNTAYFKYLRKGHAASGKPVFLVSNRQGSGSDPNAIAVTREGFPVLDGLRSFLAGMRCLFGYRDFCKREPCMPQQFDAEQVSAWRLILSRSESRIGPLSEYEAGQFLQDFGLPINPSVAIDSEQELLQAAEAMDFPLVLKTAAPELAHKTDKGGVHLNLCSRQELLCAYREMSARLGSAALLATMVAKGTEMMLGMVQDEQFGPLVLMGLGGVDVEVLDQVRCALPPFDAATARRLIDSLPLRKLLDSHRGRPAADLDAFCETAAHFSAVVAELSDSLAEIDLNPVIVHPSGCIAVDTLVLGRKVCSDVPH